jgi:hypothetical protein
MVGRLQTFADGEVQVSQLERKEGQKAGRHSEEVVRYHVPDHL